MFTTAKECAEGDEVKDLSAFEASPRPDTIEEGTEIFRSTDPGSPARADFSLPNNEAFNPKALDLKLTNVRELTVKFLAEDGSKQEKVCTLT